MNLIKKLMSTMAIFIIIPMIIMIIHISSYEYRITSEEMFDTANISVMNLNESIPSYISYVSSNMITQQVSTLFANTIENGLNIEDSKRELENIAATSISVRNTILTTPDGRIVLFHAPFDGFQVDFGTLEKCAKEKQPTADVRFMNYDKTSIFPVYIPLITNNNQISGYVINFIDTSVLNLLAISAAPNEESEVYIIDKYNNLLNIDNVVYPLSEFSINTPKSLEAVFVSESKWGYQSTYRIKYEAQNAVGRKAVLQKNPKYEFCILYSFPESNMTQSAAMIVVIMSIYIMLSIAIAFFVYYKAKASSQKPFEEIFKTIKIYESGDWSYRPQVSTSQNDFSMISDSLWHMAEKMNLMYLDLKFNEYRYKLSLEFSSDIIYDIDLIKNSVDSNAVKWEGFFGHKIGVTEKQVFGNLSNSVHPNDKAAYDSSRNRLLQDCYDGIEKKCEIEFRILLSDGDYHWVAKKDILLKGATDNIEHIVGSIVNIDEKKNIEIKARVDSLTGLYNRAEFIYRMDTLFHTATHTEGAVIFFDIDDFKHINDNYGHDVGDDVLKFVGKSILDTVGKNGIGGRYGGDELLAYVYKKDFATNVADIVLEKLSKNFIIRGTGTSIKIQSSIGIAYYPEHEDSAEKLIKKADAAMYHAKKNGKNQYRVFTPGDDNNT